MAGQVVICGMHRSGTSLAASALRRAGLDVGDRFNGAGPGNPRGHFEDADFWQLHEEMLRAAGKTALTASVEDVAAVALRFVDRARALIAARAERPLWGWKDPRTSLLLDFWDALLPDACYVILYRHPVDVALSLLRRDTDPELRHDPSLALRSWELHHRALAGFRARHPERCFVAPAAAMAADLAGFVRAVGSRFALPLRAEGVAAVLARGELTPTAMAADGPRWEGVIAGCVELFEQLEAAADLPAPRVSHADHETASTAREPALLRVAADLLFDLLASRLAHSRQRQAAEAFAAALADQRDELTEERARRTACEAEHRELTRSLSEAVARRDELATTLGRIERARSFQLVRWWWRLAARLRR